MSLRSSNRPKTFEPLDPSERMSRGCVVAIDCEFVVVEKEETVTKKNGKRVVVKPMRFSLGRVSVVRGQGPRAGLAFIDDYIINDEEIVDYVTRFSGLDSGDLDVSSSTRHLTSLKSAYIRLRSLVDRGVIFVGHALKGDMQMMNLIIPPNQIIDTSELFYLKGQRLLKLSFLAAHLLHLDIQAHTHDSIEDSRTALAAYHQYLVLKAAGTFESTLKQLYEIGMKTNWK